MYIVSFSSFVKPFQHEMRMFSEDESVKAYMSKQMNRMCHVMRYEHWNIGEHLIEEGIEYIERNFINGSSWTNYPQDWFWVCHTEYKKTTENSVDSWTFLSEVRFVKQKDTSKISKWWLGDEYDFTPNGMLFEFKIVRTDVDLR